MHLIRIDFYDKNKERIEIDDGGGGGGEEEMTN